MAQSAPPLLTAAEYVALERQAEVKHEFSHGQRVAMAGASFSHNLIVGNVVAQLNLALRGRPCGALPSDMKVFVLASGHYYYPDASVVWDAPEFTDEERDAIVNPTLLVEVLSESTERKDRGEKFREYRSIASCTDYLMCSSTEPLVEHYTRDADGFWRLHEYRAGERAPLRSLGIELSVDELYANPFPSP